ncbi:uncharacterized protein VNE69_05063 [Vairimorpha necatrix]|uniref:Uncharacterized protein n=1 Tax=Vairimorpha necatrix TaxID=6039 RepID=A0AAX4JBT5_9MICR
MNILKVVSAILFVQANLETCKIIQDDLLKKIKTGNYRFCDMRKGKNYIDIIAVYKRNKYKFYLKWTTRQEPIFQKILTIIPEGQKSVKNIIKLLEDKLKTLVNYKNENAYSFIYEEYDYYNCPITKELVEEVKKRNVLRRINKEYSKIIYENICHSGDIFEKIITEIRTLKDGSITEQQSSICYYDNLKTGKKFIVLTIDIENVLYFFEFCINELYHKFDFEVNVADTCEDKILHKLQDIYELSPDNCNLSLRDNDEYINITSSHINIRKKEEKYSIYIKTDELYFEYFNIYPSCPSEGPCTPNIYKYKVSETCNMEFEKICSKLTNTEYTNEIELFYNLLKNHNKIEFLVKRIISKPESAIHMIFSFQYRKNKKKFRSGEKFMIGNKKDSEHHITHVIRKLTKLVKEDLKGIDLYVIVICLIIEAEAYIQENDVSDDKIFKTLKEIGEIIDEKNKTTTVDTSTTEKNIDLFNILKEIVTISNNKLLEMTYKTIALFTGSNSINIYEYKGKLIKKNKIEMKTDAKESNLEVLKIKKYNEELKEKLREKTEKM